MADDFKDGGFLTLRPGDSNVPVWLRFNPASASTKNDGSVPFGSTIHAYSVTAKNYETGTASTILVDSVTASSKHICVYLDYSTTLNPGLYHLTATVTWALSGTTAMMSTPFDLERVYLKKS
jgi:hypothetical protein